MLNLKKYSILYITLIVIFNIIIISVYNTVNASEALDQSQLKNLNILITETSENAYVLFIKSYDTSIKLEGKTGEEASFRALQVMFGFLNERMEAILLMVPVDGEFLMRRIIFELYEIFYNHSLEIKVLKEPLIQLTKQAFYLEEKQFFLRLIARFLLNLFLGFGLN